MAHGRLHDTNSRAVRIEATPEPIAIDPARTAVIVVDVQHDFGAKSGTFDRAGIDLSMIQRAIGPTAKILATARKAGVKIVYLKMGFRPHLSDLGPADAPNRMRHLRFGVGETMHSPDGTESQILIRDTWNTDILPELAPQANDVVLYKHRFSGFYQTDLDTILKRLGITFLIVTGCTTSICAESTVRDAMFRDYACVVLEDCTGEPIEHGLPRSDHDASLFVIQTLFGWVARSEAFMASWRAEIPGQVVAAAEALSGPTTPPGARVQLLNPPGSAVGPGQVAIWGKATANQVEAHGFQWNWAGKSSKHIPFEWTGPA
jgi:ureidoacrylate peracid hydrolase